MRRPRVRFPGDLGRATDFTQRLQTQRYATLLRCGRGARAAAERPCGGAAHTGGLSRLLVGLEVRRFLQLLLGHGQPELVGLVLRLVARHGLEGARSQGYVLRSDAEEAADADDIGFDLAVLVEQDVADITDLLVIG